MDKISIQNLEVYAHHGVFKEEQSLGQKFLITADLFLPLYEAARTGDLDQTIHYGEVCQIITDHMIESPTPLIETVALNLCQTLFDTYPNLRGIRMEVKKPQAPIPQPLAYVSVTLEQFYRRAWISLGSNIEAEKNMAEALNLIENHSAIRILKASAVEETPAWGLEDQANFLNQVIEIETRLDPHALLKTLQAFENLLGRERTVHWGPRTMDLDILFYEDHVISDEILNIPHPYIQERAFVLDPLAQNWPHLIHPVLGQSMRMLRQQLGD